MPMGALGRWVWVGPIALLSSCARSNEPTASVHAEAAGGGASASAGGPAGGGRAAPLGCASPGDPSWSAVATSESGDRWTRLFTFDASCGFVAGGGRAIWDGSRTYYFVSDVDLDFAWFDPATGAHEIGRTVDRPTPRFLAASVVLNGRLWMWGGLPFASSSYPASDGALLDPTTDQWRPIDTTSAPTPVADPTVVVAGERVIVWGGLLGPAYANIATGGAVWSAADGSWSPIETAGQPSPRIRSAAAWTGTEMILWGGEGDGLPTDGALYDPEKRSWRPMSQVGAPPRRYSFVSAWTGSAMIAWGPTWDATHWYLEGDLYDPAADTWSPMPPVDLPIPESGYVPVWTGDRFVVFTYEHFNGPLGAATYDPTTNTFTVATTVGAPGAPGPEAVVEAAVWDGTRVLLWILAQSTVEVWAYELPLRSIGQR